MSPKSSFQDIMPVSLSSFRRSTAYRDGQDGDSGQHDVGASDPHREGIGYVRQRRASPSHSPAATPARSTICTTGPIHTGLSAKSLLKIRMAQSLPGVVTSARWLRWSLFLLGFSQILLLLSLFSSHLAGDLFHSTLFDSMDRHTGDFQAKPRMVLLASNFTAHAMSTSWDFVPTVSRKIKWKIGRVFNWEEEYGRETPEDGCEFLGEWHYDLNPSCSKFHEIDLQNFGNVGWITNGYYRDVWRVKEYNGNEIALKTLRLTKGRHVGKDVEKHRIDALAHEQLTASPHIASIFGYCMTDAIHDLGDGPDLSELFEAPETPSMEERLVIARDVAAAVADAHHLDSKGRATIAHTDIKADNFILMKGQYQLNDFNRAVMLSWDSKEEKTCGFEYGTNAGRWRSPEEYQYLPSTEKVDVWSLGNVLNFIWTGQEPFEEESSDDIPETVGAGGAVPKIKGRIHKKEELFDKTMRRALKMCFVRDPLKRSTAKQVADLLEDAVRRQKRSSTNAQSKD